MQRFIDLSGNVFGRLTAIHYEGKGSNNRSQWLCKCECGICKIIAQASLLAGHTKSCGCLQRDLASERAPANNKRNAKHGMCGRPEYRVWAAMIQRCHNQNNKNYKDYGERGIRVCERWRNFENFIADMGERPNKSLTIERKNNDGNYSKSNCKWATRKEQRANQRPKSE